MQRTALALVSVLSSAAVFGCSSTDHAVSLGTGGSPGAGGVTASDSGTGGALDSGRDSGTGRDSAADASGPVATFPTTGEALAAPDLTWTWIDFPDAFCRDGSTAGLNVSLNSASDKVMIYLESGGACFDSFTCQNTPANVQAQKGAQTGGLFDRTNAKNPVKDWNFIFVPYCTGDVHAGTNENGSVPGVTGTQKFVGRRNVEAYLQRIVPTFKTSSQVLLTGVSAGGFGASSNADLVQRAFGRVPVTLIDDSGPPMSSQYLPKCLQDKWRTLWGFDDGLLKDCGSSCPNKDDYNVDFVKFLAKKYPKREAGLIESNDDGTISAFYGYGLNGCTGSFSTPVPAAEFDAALQDLRTQMAIYPKFLTYFPASSEHTWLGGPAGPLLYSESEGGTPLVDWVTAIINNQPAENVGQ